MVEIDLGKEGAESYANQVAENSIHIGNANRAIFFAPEDTSVKVQK